MCIINNLTPYISILSPSLSTGDILSQAIPAYLLPLNLLSRNRELPPQGLEGTLGHLTKSLVQFLLVAALGGRNARDDALRGGVGYGYADGLRGVERDVSVFVVVHVDMDLASDGCGVANGNLVDRAEPAVPTLMHQSYPPMA